MLHKVGKKPVESDYCHCLSTVEFGYTIKTWL